MTRPLVLALSAALISVAPASAQTERVAPESAGQVQLSFAPVVREAAPAVVNVYSTRVIRQRVHPFFQSRGYREREVPSLGSGVIVDETGVIVTNYHVVEGAHDLRVVLADRREFEAEVLLADERTDLAVLKVETGDVLPAIVYDDGVDAEVGDLVLAIGNPFGVGQTVTSGIVSALARTDVGITDYSFFIQTDAAVNPGNSGGALVDMDGELIGVNTAIFSRSGGSNGIGFAIPVEMVRTVVAAALEDGEIVRPWLGAKLQPVTSDLAQSIGLDRPRGAIIADVWPNGAADQSGLQQGDIVVAVDGVEIFDESGARFRFATRMIGETADLTVLRGEDRLDFTVEAVAAPGDLEGERWRAGGRNPLAGAELVELSPAFNEENGIDPFLDGIMVFGVERRSAARYFGFRPGDRVLSVDGSPVSSLDDIEAILGAGEGQRRWPVEIERDGEVFSQTLRL